MQGDAIRASLERMRAEQADLDRILTTAVELVHASHPRYHWTGIYEVSDDGTLRLGPFVGPASDHPFIAGGPGVSGLAIAEQRNLNIPDVSAVRGQVPTAGAARSELIVLIRREDRIYAQLDIDSQILGPFDDDDVLAVEIVADFLAECYAARDRA